jgi:hypothetical protein
MKDAETRLRYFAREVARLRDSPTASKPYVAAIKQFQRNRLAQTHADLLQSDRYRLAAQFFLDELYGVKDFSSRDAELARMIPSMARLLPSSALGAIADAVELDAISEQLDDAMGALLQASSAAPQALTDDRYFALYRATGKPDLRARQIALIEDIGRELDRLLGKPFLYRILKGMERPARLAGLGQMQAFLVSGFEAFRAMKGADHFIRTIVSRERELMAQTFAAGANPGSTDPAGNDAIGERSPEI